MWGQRKLTAPVGSAGSGPASSGRVREVYAGEPGAIGAARRLAAAFLDDVRTAGTAVGPQCVADVQLVVSELVTNAVKHAGGPCGVELRLLDRDTVLEIAVWDGSAHGATVMEPDPERVGRHGMEIVTALCGGFEVTRIPEGKRITVRMDLRPAPVA
jgi:anti-sigma regulatory factor (Ser/Thr protein kinase)